MKTINHGKSNLLYGIGLLLIVLGIFAMVMGIVLALAGKGYGVTCLVLGLLGLIFGILFRGLYPISHAAERYLAKEGDTEFYEEIEDPNHNTEQ